MASRLPRQCCQSSVVHGGAQGKPPVYDARSFADLVAERLKAVGFKFDQFPTFDEVASALGRVEFVWRTNVQKP